MSIILKGIDVPKSNGHFELYTSANGKWRIVANDGAIDVEAIQIPTPHGRLIEEHYPGELQAKQPEGLFIMYRSADKDTDRFILEAEE